MKKPVKEIANALWRKFEEFSDEEIVRGCGAAVTVESDGVEWYAEVSYTESRELSDQSTEAEISAHLENLIAEAAQNAVTANRYNANVLAGRRWCD